MISKKIGCNYNYFQCIAIATIFLISQVSINASAKPEFNQIGILNTSFQILSKAVTIETVLKDFRKFMPTNDVDKFEKLIVDSGGSIA